MLFKAMVKNSEGKLQIIESEYNTKTAFIQDLRRNGYKVNPYKVKTAEKFDHIVNNTNCEEWDWKETEWHKC